MATVNTHEVVGILDDFLEDPERDNREALPTAKYSPLVRVRTSPTGEVAKTDMGGGSPRAICGVRPLLSNKQVMSVSSPSTISRIPGPF